MKVQLDNINYKGHHFGHVEFELPEHVKFDEIPEGKLVEYIEDHLDLIIKDQEKETN